MSDVAAEVQTLRAQVLELRGSLDAERLARMHVEGRLDDLLERFENFVREVDAQAVLRVGQMEIGDSRAATGLSGSAPHTAPAGASGAGDAMAELAAAHAQYLREEAEMEATPAPNTQRAPAVGDVSAGDEKYWARYRLGSWQGEIRDEGEQEEDATPRRKVPLAATEDEYWNQHL
jgi:hypothetical protein